MDATIVGMLLEARLGKGAIVKYREYGETKFCELLLSAFIDKLPEDKYKVIFNTKRITLILKQRMLPNIVIDCGDLYGDDK